ncbi:VOC family protein [Dermatophilaceae bacterium Soc4.6]
MAIARRPTTVVDCPDPEALAAFYAALLDWQVKVEDGWAEAWSEDWPPLAFQRVDDYRRPTWPDQEVPQQHHIDVVVDDLDEGEAAVRALGATRAEHQPGTTFRVFLDPAGHPFCLCLG